MVDELRGQFPNQIIRASAGTGKTFELSNRYLKLLASGAQCETILATTFTKKGAGEILDRIIERLSDAALDDEKAEKLGPLVGSPEDYQPQANDRFVLAIGYMDARDRIHRMICDRGGKFAQFIHPLAFIANNATIGDGAVIYPFAVVSNAARVGEQVHLNYYASVGHDVEVGDCCLLAPYATLNGFSAIDDMVYMSTHATVVVAKRVGARSKVSANSTVQRDVPPDMFVHGVPGTFTRKGGLG